MRRAPGLRVSLHPRRLPPRRHRPPHPYAPGQAEGVRVDRAAVAGGGGRASRLARRVLTLRVGEPFLCRTHLRRTPGREAVVALSLIVYKRQPSAMSTSPLRHTLHDARRLSSRKNAQADPLPRWNQDPDHPKATAEHHWLTTPADAVREALLRRRMRSCRGRRTGRSPCSRSCHLEGGRRWRGAHPAGPPPGGRCCAGTGPCSRG